MRAGRPLTPHAQSEGSAAPDGITWHRSWAGGGNAAGSQRSSRMPDHLAQSVLEEARRPTATREAKALRKADGVSPDPLA